MPKIFQACALVWALCSPLSPATPLVVTTRERLALHHQEFLEERRDRLIARTDVFSGPAVAQVIEEDPATWKQSSYGWHHQINTAVFWVGQRDTSGGKARASSAWDLHWMASFGGEDHPHRRSGYAPSGFTPEENPFYFALPYNDLDATGRHRPEAEKVIPWFRRDYQGPSISVCKDRWIAIHHQQKVCYAQWKDVSPISSDDWNYVFRQQRPKTSSANNPGLRVSPAVRDYLELRSTDRVSWRFVEENEVPAGPWFKWTRKDLVPGLPVKP